MEISVNSILEQYRLALIGIWNHFFLPWPATAQEEESVDWGETASAFRAASPTLFRELVGRKIELEHDLSVSMTDVRIRPRGLRMLGTEWAEIHVSAAASGPGGLQFTGDIRRIERLTTELVFADYWDWFPEGVRTFEYYLATVAASTRYPEIVGRMALIKVVEAEAVIVSLDGG
ncbi:hypothetical protein [Paludibaculum fermentans]|uniref:hypothetical protein n=1 Tax=Paludibaculum fermentans TaxID=1473598 RepID=UPI003EBCFA89